MRTEKQTRFCDYCGDPLPLDSRSSRKYCRPKVMRDGKKKTCRYYFNNRKKLPGYHLTKGIKKYFLATYERVDALYKSGKRFLTEAELESENIQLSQFPKYLNTTTGNYCFEILEYVIEKIIDQTYQIKPKNDAKY